MSTQVPPQQASPLAQARPQAPQLLPSVRGLTHASPHSISPLRQVHDPSTQILPPAQALPQAPQWSASVLKVRQTPSQHRWPAPHWAVLPHMQLLPVQRSERWKSQTAPHAPQLKKSLPLRFWQRPEQQVNPVRQGVPLSHVQRPPSHALPSGQTTPLHVQIPSVQVFVLPSLLQRVPQVPQLEMFWLTS